jgi:predicted nucleic acid-binding protein
VIDRSVVNTSPLIFLGGAGLLELLSIEAREILIPEPVWSEVVAKGDTNPLAVALRSAPYLKPVKAVPVPETVAAWDLGAGESAVLACALATPGSSVILDDLAARRCALAHRLEVTGTLGLVLRAHKRGDIVDPRATITSLRSRGRWLSDSVVEKALSLLTKGH